MNGMPHLPQAFLRACAPLQVGRAQSDGTVEWTAPPADGHYWIDAPVEEAGIVGVADDGQRAGHADGERTAADLQIDSRRVRPGDVFAAVKGRTVDGHDYIPQALDGGASLVLCDPSYRPGRMPEASPQDGVVAPVLLHVADLGERLGSLAQVFYGEPARELSLVGVTGTNGKTTVATLVWSLLRALGVPASLLGTTGGRILDRPLGGDGKDDGPALTTADPVRLARWMSEMRRAGSTHLVMEVSSHALDQNRVQGLSFDVGAFTNLSHDHLDYHGSMHDYARAKRRLFEGLSSGATAVLNAQDPAAADMAKGCAARIWCLADSQGQGEAVAPPDGVWRLSDVRQTPTGTAFTLTPPPSAGTPGSPPEPVPVRTPLMGRFNADNAALSLMCAVALGFDLRRAAEALEHAPGVPGRMERIAADTERAPIVLVDFAHTPDALERVLQTARGLLQRTESDSAHAQDLAAHPRSAQDSAEHAQDRPAAPSGQAAQRELAAHPAHGKSAIQTRQEPRLAVVFGCGGDRDRAKRPEMGAVAARLADATYLTSDNPRTEDPLAILEQIEHGYDQARKRTTAQGERPSGSPAGPAERIPDREMAIFTAIARAKPGDVVLIAGKGHETVQVVGAVSQPFDDREVARRALRAAVASGTGGNAGGGAASSDTTADGAASVSAASVGAAKTDAASVDAPTTDAASVGAAKTDAASAGAPTTHAPRKEAPC